MPTCSNSVATAASDSSSTSIVSMEAAMTGWHVLKVEGYSRLKGRGIGKLRTSGPFCAGGHIWSIPYYLEGYDKNSADWISVGIELHRPSPTDGDVKALVKSSLLDKDGELVSTHTYGEGCVRTFSSKSPSWGYNEFIKRDYLLESPYFVEDSFCIRFDVTVLKETCELSVVPPPDLHQHLGNLLSSGVGGDVKFEVGEETFIAHKNVLAARSPVFMAEFFGCPMKEKLVTDEKVRVEGIDARVFKAMLYFIYTDTLPDMDGGDKIVMAQHLLVAADRYNINRLKLISENTLRTYMNTSVAATTLVLAEQHGCHGLKEACVKFLESPCNLKEVMAGDDFNHLKSSCPSVVQELLAKLTP